MTDFYTSFDTETLGNRHQDDFRSVFQIDRDRVLYSAAFRRLQNKTQVFKSGSHDFYRTRLTHSLEVAQIGRSIVNYINKKQFHFQAIDSDLVEGICLAHDLGNPPYGHSGEAKMNELMREAGGFEGNAQTLKIVAEQLHEDLAQHRGMKPSRAFVDGILKYKVVWSGSNKKGKFLYDDQIQYLDFVADGPAHFSDRSLECEIMNWADDVAYALHDLADGFLAGLIQKKSLYSWAEKQSLSPEQSRLLDIIIQKLDHKEDFDRYLASRTGLFIESVSVKERAHPLAGRTNRYKYSLAIEPEIELENDLYKRMAVDLIFRSPQIEQMEFKGRYIIEKLFHAFMSGEDGGLNTRILPHEMRDKLTDEILASKILSSRLVCDYFAEQTDVSLPRLFRRLFDPDYSVYTHI